MKYRLSVPLWLCCRVMVIPPVPVDDQEAATVTVMMINDQEGK
jgi:hypothetical protein